MHRLRYLVGSVTLVAAVIGAWWIVSMLRNLDNLPGLLLQIEFRDVRGLRAGADVRYRGVTVGTVRSIAITRDGGKAVAQVLLDPTGAAQAWSMRRRPSVRTMTELSRTAMPAARARSGSSPRGSSRASTTASTLLPAAARSRAAA